MHPHRDAVSRRDFLKLSGLGLMGLASLPGLPFNSFFEDPFDAQQGRVTARLIWTYDRPSFLGGRVKIYWRDAVVPIINVTVNEDDQEAYNRVWYQLAEAEFAYSGNLQPVRTLLNTPSLTLPGERVLAEVSVPYTDAHEQTESRSRVGYRMYYETTHWVEAVTSSPDGSIWYKILDDKWNKLYYVPAAHLRLLPDDELAPLAPDVPEADKKIVVKLDDQLLLAYQGGVPVYATRTATGGIFRTGTYSTPSGSFMTYHKRPTRHMAAGDLTANGFDLAGVPWVMYLTESGISIHGTFWHNDFGRPRSHGCINLTPASAKWLFRWTTPAVAADEIFAYKPKGTVVEIGK
jgi:lipoprotein-anchoring transpeptidase ErfK/SrfK